MNLVLDIASSIEFWRQRYPGKRAPKPPKQVVPKDVAFRKQDIMPLVPDWALGEFLVPTNGVLHVLSLERKRARQLYDICIHSWTGPIPNGAFYEPYPGLYVESPSFMFLHAASILSFEKLIAFGDELCGLYSFDMRDERGFKSREKSLLTKTQIRQFLQHAQGCRGYRQAMRALPHVIEHSASPMETFDEMTLCLPYRYGGYAQPTPVMNHQVNLSAKAARVARRQKCYLDLGYPYYKLDIEHHGKHDHSSEEEMASDRARVNGLKEMGFEVIELTSGQVGDLFAYEVVVERIARIVGKRLWEKRLGPTPERLQLRKELYAWNDASGAIR